MSLASWPGEALGLLSPSVPFASSATRALPLPLRRSFSLLQGLGTCPLANGSKCLPAPCWQRYFRDLSWKKRTVMCE